MKNFKIKANKDIKVLQSPHYNYIFSYETGFFARWGKTKNDDPILSPFGPEIADIELSTKCRGINNKPCPHCYKSNVEYGKNMSFEMFKIIFHKLPKTLTQIAFGIGSIDLCPDLWKIMDYCRNNDYNKVIPNITIDGDSISQDNYDNLAKYCGAVAVSFYGRDICFDAIQELSNKGMKQVNIHMIVSEETYETCINLIDWVKEDERAKGLSAIVFLGLKQKGRGEHYTKLSNAKFEKVINKALKSKINFGFDSCTANKFLQVIKGTDSEKLSIFAEPCEQNLFSCYINVEGKYWHCSFTEDEPGIKPIDMLKVNNFLEEVWWSPDVVEIRKKLIEHKRSCPFFDV